MRRSDLGISIISLGAGVTAAAVSLAVGGDALGWALAAVLLLNALVRFQLARGGE